MQTNIYGTDGSLNKKALEEAILRFDAIYNSIAIGICILDKDGVLVDCNSVLLKMFGIENKQEWMEAKVCFDNDPNFSAAVLGSLKSGKTDCSLVHYDFDEVNENGLFTTTIKGRKVLEMRTSNLIDSNNEHLGYVMTVLDVTDSKQHIRIEQSIYETQREITQALETGNLWTWIYLANEQKFHSIIGDLMPREGISLEKALTLIHPDDKQNFLALIDDIISARRDSGEIVVRFFSNESGDYKYYEGQMYIRPGEHGIRDQIAGTQRDVTDRYLQKLEANNVRRSLDMALATSNLLAWDYDLHTQKSRILYGELAGEYSDTNPINNIDLHPEDIQRYNDFASRVARGELDKDTIEVRIRSKEGVYRYVESTIANLRNSEGKITHLIGSSIDISDRREREKADRDMKTALEIIMNAGDVSVWKYIIKERKFYAMLGEILLPDGTTYEQCADAIAEDCKATFHSAFDDLISGKTDKGHTMFHFIHPQTGEGIYYRNELAVLLSDRGERTTIIGTQKDITNDILQQRLLEEFQIKTKLINEKNNIIQWDYDIARQLIITHGNGAIQEGIAMDKQMYLSYIHPDDKQFVEDYLDKMSRSELGDFDTVIRAHIPGHAEYRHLVINILAIKDIKGEITGYTGIRNDTTEMEMMNDSIRESKIKTDMAMKNANMVMWEYSVADQTFTAFNDPLTNYDATREYTPEEYIEVLDSSSVEEAAKAVAFMNRRELGEFSFKSKIMLPDSNDWQYITVQGSHSEVSPTDPTKATKYVGFRVDNTELVKLSQEIEESNTLTNSILDQSPSAIFIKDITNDWRYIIGNDLFCQLFNYTEDQIIGYTDHEIFTKEVADKFHSDDLKAASYNGIYSFVEEVVTDGIVKALHTTKRVITTANGRQLLIGITSDISETVAQQRALEQANQKSELVLNNANTGLVYVDNDFRIVWENADSVKDNPHIHKYKRGGICYKNIHGLNEPCPDCVIRKARESRNTEKRRQIFDDGTVLDIFATPVLGEDNQPNGYVCRIDNVTDYVLTTRQLEESQKYLDLAIHAGNVAVWGYDPMRDVVFNISGRVFTKDVLPLSEANDYVHPDDFPTFRDVWMRLVNGQSDNENICLRFKSPITGKMEYVDKSMTTVRTPSGELEMIIGTHHDVTEDKIQKMALEDSNEKLNMALDVIQAFSWHCDMRNRKLLFDSNFISLGLDPNTMDSIEKFVQNIHPDDRHEFLDIINRFVLRGDGEFITTYRIDLRNNGNYEWWECRGKLKIMSENGHTYKYLYGMNCNVTHHKQITDELTKAKIDSDNAYILLNNIIQQIPFGLFIKDIEDDLRYLLVNDTLAQRYNLTVDAFTGRTDHEILPKELADQFYQDDHVTMDRNGELFVKTKTTEIDGVSSIWEITEVMCTNTDGRRMLIGLIGNISERERTRIELQKSKEKAEEASALLQSIIKQIPFGLYIKDIENDFRYVIMNDVLANIDHIDSKYAIGKTDYELFDKKIADMFKAENLLAAGKPDGELTVVKSNIDWHGQKNIYENSDTVITVANGRRLLIGVVADITEKDRMLKELRDAKERAEQSDKLKSAFLANMSHEIRTPLNAIVGFSALLIDAEDAAEREEYTNIISVNNELLLRLIGDILDLSKIESGMIELKSEVFDISEVCDEVYMMLNQKVTNPKVGFVVENPYRSCIVELDKNRLKQVGINFITNAIKYTAEGTIKMGYSYVDDGIEIYVEDTGIGIAQDNHDKVFQRFEKFDTFAQGTGLGLSICKAIVDAQGGRIGFKSEPGKGSRFWAWFPCSARITESEVVNEVKTADSDEIIWIEPESDKELRILIAEDNDSNYMLIKHILKGYDITRACNGAEAVELAKSEKFNIILMDWKMPVMNGVDATIKIREFDKKTPIIAVTANAFDSNKASILEAGCNAFVAKPLKKQELFDALQLFQK